MGRKLVSGLVIGVLLLNVFGNVEAASSQTLATFSVPATVPWTSTNVVVGSGMHVTIAAEGMIHVNVGGAVQLPGGDGGSPGCIADASFVAPGLPCWSLIGRIDNGAPFEIGARRRFTARRAGRLFLGVNDQNIGFSDNSGAWVTVIKVSPAMAFSVLAMQPWTGTGIIPRAGSRVVITAAGIIHVNNGGAVQSPNGNGGAPDCVADATFVAPGLRCWSLIGRIGNGAPFEIGSHRAFTVSSSGQLFLGVNDQIAGFNDNSGFWTAVINVSRPLGTSTIV